MPDSTTGDVIVCDSQVHAPDLPSSAHVGGIEPAALLHEMDEAGVDSCVIVPLAAAGSDAGANNGPALEMARRHPHRFAVMGRYEIAHRRDPSELETWRSSPEMLGIRLSFVRDPNLTLLVERRLDWFWSAAQEHRIPLMILVPNDRLAEVAAIAATYPELRLTVDHLGLTPYVIYDDVDGAIDSLLELAAYPNVAVKASALPASVPDPFPFRSVHKPLQRVLEAFGARRLFWGSDLTRLTCPYSQCVRLFTDELPFLTGEDRELVLGRALMDWLGWDTAEGASDGAH